MSGGTASSGTAMICSTIGVAEVSGVIVARNSGTCNSNVIWAAVMDLGCPMRGLLYSLRHS